MLRSLIVSLASLLLSVAAAPPARTEGSFNFDNNPGKLPKNVVPTAYRIELAPNFDDLVSRRVDRVDFAGTVDIDIKVTQPTRTITLNAAGLDLKDAALDRVKPKKFEPDEHAETWTFQFDNEIGIGAHNLVISYTGKIVPEPTGIYYSDYDYKDPTTNTTRTIRFLSTQFEPAHARKMFPGWDEPAFKATFTLSLLMADKYKDIFLVVSNTKEQPNGRKAVDQGRIKITFEPTPKMSSYLVVLTAGELERLPDPTPAPGVEIGVVVPKGRKDEATYAIEVTKKLLPLYNKYFGIDYPLPKLDLIAVPNFEVGAMENWGGITFLDDRILVGKNTTQSEREEVFETIAHEVAHQWFGDLVTMGWWNDLWLNEGFANWMQKKATDELNKSWDAWARSHDDKEGALLPDALRTTHPLEVDIVEESQMETAFDTITYQKGGHVIRMIEDYLGADVFEKGLQLYMQDRKYNNASAANLWAKLAEAAPGDKKQQLRAIAASFTEHSGVPLIHVETRCSDDKKKTHITLRQSRFAVHDPLPAQGTWQVPVRIGRAGAKDSIIRVVGESPTQVDLDGCDAAVKASFGDIGYYRVQYHGDALSRITEAYCQLLPPDRVNLLTDSWALVEASADATAVQENLKTYLELTRWLSSETQLVVWTSVLKAFRQIDDLARGDAVRDKFRDYARRLLAPLMNDLGWPKAGTSDDPLTVQLRGLVITTLGRFGDDAVIKKAGELFKGLVADPASIDSPDLKTIVATVVGYWADADTYRDLQNLAVKAKQANENYMIYYNALAGASDPALIKKSIDLAADTEEIQRGTLDRFIIRTATSSDNPEKAWELVTKEPTLGKIFNKLTGMKKQRLLPSMASVTANPRIAYELKWIAQPRDGGGPRYEADKAAEQIEFSADFKPLLLPALTDWLASNPQPRPRQKCS
jgi:aminopeptidase N